MQDDTTRFTPLTKSVLKAIDCIPSNSGWQYSHAREVFIEAVVDLITTDRADPEDGSSIEAMRNIFRAVASELAPEGHWEREWSHMQWAPCAGSSDHDRPENW